MKSAVILLSGGLDSTTTVAIAKSMDFKICALSVNYGQRNGVELSYARRVVEFFHIQQHRIIDFDMRLFGGSSLTDDLPVMPHDPNRVEMANTYVPARNTIMLSWALAYAEVMSAQDIFYGAHIHDYSDYPDCRKPYIDAFEKMANLALKNTGKEKITIHAPLVDLTKAEIIQKGLALGVDYSMTFSCYDPKDDLACGECSACFYRKKGFVEAQVPDPTRYAKKIL